MGKFILSIVIAIQFAICNFGFTQTVQYYQTGEEFSGPFPSWKNVKTDFGAKGDGVTNDAPAINAALLAMQVPAKDSFNVLFFPAGTYLINDSLYNPNPLGDYDGMAIVGEDPATTIISWNGQPGGDMFVLKGWYLRVSRLTFEGNNKAYRGIFKAGGFSTHNEFSDIVFKDFNNGIGLDLSGTNQGQAENAIIRCTFSNCSSGIASCNWNSLDQWVWWCLFEDCNLAINQCVGYFQIYNNVFLRSKTYDIGSSPYKNAIINNTSINSKCFFAGDGAYLRGNKIYSNVDSFYTNAGTNTVMLDNVIRCTKSSYAITRVGSANMFVGDTFSTISSQWKKWPFQPPFDPRDHGLGASMCYNHQIEKAIDGNPNTSFVTDIAPFGIKWNCPMGTQRTVVKYSVSAPAGDANAPANFQLLGSNNWGYSWDVLDFESNQTFTGGGKPIMYPIKNKTAYGMYELLAINPWQLDVSGGRSIVNTGAQSGTFCEQIIAVACCPRTVWQTITVKPDTFYTASGWMKSNAITTKAYMLVYWYNKTYPPSSEIFSGYIKADTIGIITGTNGWTYYSQTLTAPGTALAAQFCLASLSTSGSTGTVWFDNLSFSSTKTPAKNLLLDPGFESGPNPSWFEVSEFTLLDSLGNDLTKDVNGFVSGADESWGDFYPIDNIVTDTTSIPIPTTISLPGTPQNLNRKIFEVVKGTGNDANAIQTEINSAANESFGTKPVVHIPFGQFNITKTITVPAGSDMQIISDGLGTGTTTRLVWAGNQIGPLLDCKGPSSVTIKDLLLSVPYASYVGPEALVIEDADQAGGRIFGNNFYAGGPQWTQPCDIGLLSDSIENSDITMICSCPGFGSTAMVQATGGTVLSAGGNTEGQISFLAGATGDCQNLFNVTNGGRIDAEGMWNEGDFTRTSGLLNLSNTSGKVSIACMSWTLTTALPMLNTDNFSGTLTLLLNHFHQTPWSFMPLTGDGSNLTVLSAYNDWGQGDTKGVTTDSTWEDMTSPAATADFISNTAPNGMMFNGVVNKVFNVRADTTSILNSLAQLRAVRTEPPNDRQAGVTDVKLFRVAAWGTKGNVAAHFHGARNTTGINAVEAPVTKTGLVSLYPTLVEQYYTVSYELPQAGSVSFIVYDVFGRQISEKILETSKGTHQSVFSIDGLNAGTYFLKFQSETIVETKKFIVTK